MASGGAGVLMLKAMDREMDSLQRQVSIHRQTKETETLVFTSFYIAKGLFVKIWFIRISRDQCR